MKTQIQKFAVETKITEATEISVIFPTNTFFSSGIRDFTQSLVRNMTNLSEQWAFRFQLIVDELCNNAIEHGSATGENIRCSFHFEPDEYLEVTVEDSGTGSSPKKAAELESAMREDAKRDPLLIDGVRHRGISHIVLPLADSVLFEDREGGGVRVRVRKFFQKS